MSWPMEYDHIFRLFSVVKPKRNYWLVCCPAHDDVHPSCTVRIGTHGLLLKCHGPKCPFHAILGALAARAGRALCCKPHNGEDDRRPGRVVRKVAPLPITRTYPYPDENGEVLYETCRIEPGPDGKRKTFAQRRPNPAYDARTSPPDQQHVWNLEGVRRVLYGLPDLIDALKGQDALPWPKRRIVWLLEGEKDAETARRLGLLATTNVCGAKNLHLTETDVLAGSRVVVPFDRDEPDKRTGVVPGVEHALQAVNILTAKGCRVQPLRLPGGPGDFTDWIESWPKGVPPEEIMAELRRLIRLAPPWGPWGPEGGPENVPRLCRWMVDGQDAMRSEGQKVAADRELFGELSLGLEALRQEFVAARQKKQPIDGKAAARRLAYLGAWMLIAAEDLKLFGADDAKSREPDEPAGAGNHRGIESAAVR